MGDYESSSQLNYWLFAGSPNVLEQCRARANREARDYILKQQQNAAAADSTSKPPVFSFARGIAKRKDELVSTDENSSEDSTSDASGHPFVTPEDESLLVDFYASKLPSLLGPLAQIARLKRDVKVPSTAALLYRRFFLSNSVLLYDPKAIMLAAAFLASKVEDATTDIRYLEEGTKLMNAPVTAAEMIPAELALIEGIGFDLQCFHPYKAVTAFTEDLRVYLKSDKGRSLVTNTKDPSKLLSGQDLKPMHDRARLLIDDVVVSDIPLLYSPGQIGLAALMVANEALLEEKETVPKIDLLGYCHERFNDDDKDDQFIKQTMEGLCVMLKGLKDGKHGCATHHVDMQKLKAVHKKLKKCRAWGQKKSKKRKAQEQAGEDDNGPDTKKAKQS